VRKSSVKNVLMKDGTARRVPGERAEELLDSGQAQHYISNTIYKALKLGIEVPDTKTRDGDGKLRAKIRDAREREGKKRKKKDEKDARKADREEALESDD